MLRRSFRRTLIAGTAGVSMLVAMVGMPAQPASASAFSMSLVGGSFTLGSQGTVSLGGASTACQNGTDDELLAPFGSPDGLIDYPADPDCASPFDNNESLPGVQAPDPIEFTGTIDGAGNFSVASSFTPTTFTLTAASPTPGVCDGDVLVTRAITNFTDLAPNTGNINTGTLNLHLRIDNNLDIECDTDLGAGQSFAPFDFDGAGGMAPWGGATPVACAHDISSQNTSASGDSAAASVSKTQDATVTGPMAGKEANPVMIFGDVFDAVPITTADTRCGFFDTFVFGTASTDNSALQFGFIDTGDSYEDLPGIDVNLGDVTVPEGDGGLGAHGCAGKDCKNSVSVVVSLSSPATVDSTITVIADNTTGGSANGTAKGTELLPKPSDYKATTALKPKVLKIKAGKSTAKFTIAIAPDQIKESAETIFVDVIAVSAGLVINDGTGMVTILDDDDASEPDTGISIGDATVYETGASAVCGGEPKCKGTAVVPIVAESPLLADTALTYTITNGSDVVGVFNAAEAVNGKTIGDDFMPVLVAKVKTIKLGKNNLALVITIIGDNTFEAGEFRAETLTVTISGAGVRDAIGTVRILNDDV